MQGKTVSQRRAEFDELARQQSASDLKAKKSGGDEGEQQQGKEKKPKDPAKQKEKVLRLFQKYDTDKSGGIDTKEFQVLAFDLGLPLTDDESAAFVKELDTDGNGTVEFDEFFAWWSNPDKKTSEDDPERTKKLKVLKIRLRTKSVLASASNITTTLANTTEKAEKIEKKDQSNFDLKISVGEFDAPRCSLEISHVQSDEQAAAVRKLAKADDGNVVISIRLTPKAGVDEFRLGEVSGGIKNLLEMAADAVQYSSFDARMIKVDSKDVFSLSFVFSEAKIPQLEQLNAVLGSLHITELSAKAELSEKPGDPASGEIAKFRLAFRVGLDRGVLRMMMQGLSEAGQREAAQGLAGLVAIKNASFNLDIEDLNHILKREVFPQLPPVEHINGWHSLRAALVTPVAGLMLNDQIPEPIRDLYSSILETLSDIHSLQVALGNNVLTVACPGFAIFDNYLPTLEEMKQELANQLASIDASD